MLCDAVVIDARKGTGITRVGVDETCGLAAAGVTDAPRPLPRFLPLLCGGWLLLLSGCASWHSQPPRWSEAATGLPTAQTPLGNAVLDLSFISLRPPQVDSDQAADSDAGLWQSIDEMLVPAETRRRLRRNGLRVGKVISPNDFATQLEPYRSLSTETSEVLEATNTKSDLSHESRRITCRVGKRYELPVRQTAAGDRVVLVNRDGQTSGQTLPAAQPLFALRARALDARTVTLQLTPEIQHGPLKQTWVGNDMALRMEPRRDAWVLSELAVELPLQRGEMLVIGAAEPDFGLGSQFFSGLASEGEPDRTILLIRVHQLPPVLGDNP